MDRRDTTHSKTQDIPGTETPEERQVFLKQANDRLATLVKRSRAALFLERFWRAVFPGLVVLAIFIGFSLIGGWLVLPAWVRLIGLCIFAIAAVWSFRDLLLLKWPSREDALSRIERSSKQSHRPLTAVEDSLATGRADPATQALWRLHKRRMAEALKAMRAGAPDPRAYKLDPYAVRVAALMLLVVGMVSSGEDRWSRLGSAFRAPVDVAAIASRLDAWVTPPLYTDKPPLYLTGESAALRDQTAPIKVPEGTVFVVRSQGAEDFRMEVSGDIEANEEDAPNEELVASNKLPVERGALLAGSGRIELYSGETLITGWAFDVLPDEAPEIRLTNDPEEQLSGALKFSYLVKDDYGVVSAEAFIQPVSKSENVLGASRPLVEAPQFPLSLPSRSGTAKTGETIRDITSHPWAGSDVELTMVARDQAGQEGVSPPHVFTLPQRPFRKPLARAVVEQRRNLALDANNHARVLMAFDALLLAPASFGMPTKDYLGLRFAYKSLVHAQSDDELRELLPLLWDLALTIEDGDLSLAERALRDAQEALRKALEEGASDEEIAKLTENLREAMNEYMQALADQMRRNPQQMQPFNSQQQQSLSQQDLSEMLDRIEELARTGSRDAARELLAQMQQMMENMQAGRPQMSPDSMTSEMMEMLNELGEMIQKQQQLMDETHQLNRQQQQNRQRQQQGQSGQRGQQPGQQPMTAEQLAEALKQLQEGQGDLAQQLQQLMDQMAQNGQGEGNELGEAGEAMGQAQESLGEGQGEQAVGQQGNALDALRRGAEGMAEQMMGQGEGPGMAQGRSPRDEDPLGRPRRTEGPDFGNQVKVPDEIDVQRARRILEELRRRFSDPSRPKLELDYLERLLKRY
ncbi:TIGR02302 family protein [Roseibium algae]|uniref:TIGR02302 family protein n=1 Tax=Roseibium algae TaxID=3123038 RepID=A0ABU8TL72_9HYPH